MGADRVAFVLGGGGHLGAHEVGMLRALLEQGIVPDVLVGTSIGAINGAAVSAQPTSAPVERLAEVWGRLEESDAFGGSILGRLGTLARSRTHLHDNARSGGCSRSGCRSNGSRTSRSLSSAWRRASRRLRVCRFRRRSLDALSRTPI